MTDEEVYAALEKNRQCIHCMEIKDIYMFGKQRVKGKLYIGNICLECKKKYMKERAINRAAGITPNRRQRTSKKKVLEKFKIPCSHCNRRLNINLFNGSSLNVCGECETKLRTSDLISKNVHDRANLIENIKSSGLKGYVITEDRAVLNKYPNDDNQKMYQSLRHAYQRMRLINLYGGKCECCGEPRMEFLCIDHTEGSCKKDVGDKNAMYYYRRMFELKEKIPGYRCLCHNCNMSIGFYGYCPHNKPENIRGYFDISIDD